MITLLLLLLVFVAYVIGELAALRKRVAHVEERVGVTHGSPATSTATARPPITTAPPASPAPLERDVRRPPLPHRSPSRRARLPRRRGRVLPSRRSRSRSASDRYGSATSDSSSSPSASRTS